MIIQSYTVGTGSLDVCLLVLYTRYNTNANAVGARYTVALQ